MDTVRWSAVPDDLSDHLHVDNWHRHCGPCSIRPSANIFLRPLLGAGAAGAIGAFGTGAAAGITLTTLALPVSLLVVGHCRICPYRALSGDSYYHARGHVGREPIDKRPFGRGRACGNGHRDHCAGAARTMSTAAGMTAAGAASASSGSAGPDSSGQVRTLPPASQDYVSSAA